MATLMKQRRDSALNWSTVNPILADGEIGYEKVSGKFKIGDGLTAWNDLGYSAIKPEEKGVAGGVCPLDGAGKVAAEFLPSYVDDVEEYADFDSLPAEGETGKLYVTLDDNKVYRWSGTMYIEIAATPTVIDGGGA